MKPFGSILLIAGCLFGIPQAYAQEVPEHIPAYRPADFALKAYDAAQELMLGGPEPFSLQWLREETNPILRERRRIHRTRQVRAEEQRSAIALSQNARKQDPNKAVGIWRMSVGNTSANNWSPFQDRMLDARTLRFPMRRDAKADKRPDHVKALDGIRQQRK